MSREKTLAKNTVLLMIGKICTQCVSFFMLPLYTAILTTEEYGTADLIITYVSLLYPIIGMQFEQGLFRMMLDYRDSKENKKTLFTTVLICNLIQIIIFTIVFLPVRLFFKSVALSFLLPLVIIQIIQGTLLQFARGIGRTDVYTIGSFINAVIHVGFNVVLVGVVKIGLTGLFYSMILAGIGSSLFVFFYLEVWHCFEVQLFSINEFKGLARYSLPLIPNQLAWWIVNASDRTIISYFIGTGSNGIYSVANKFSSLYITFYNYFNMSWTESVSLAINDEDKDEYISKMINIFFNLISALCIGIIAFMPFVFSILVNETYKGAYYQIPFLMVAVFFQALQGLYSAIYVALKKTKEIAKTSSISAFINILVNVALIKSIGLYAASISSLVAFMSMAIYRYVDIKKYVSIKIYVKNILISTVICLITCAAYYSENLLISLANLVIVITYSILMNKIFISKMITFLRSKIRKIRRY